MEVPKGSGIAMLLTTLISKIVIISMAAGRIYWFLVLGAFRMG